MADKDDGKRLDSMFLKSGGVPIVCPTALEAAIDSFTEKLLLEKAQSTCNETPDPS